ERLTVWRSMAHAGVGMHERDVGWCWTGVSGRGRGAPHYNIRVFTAGHRAICRRGHLQCNDSILFSGGETMTSGPDIAWVDTLDVCHMKCVTCIRGVRGMQNSARKMSLDTFVAVVARLREHGFRRIALFNWTEPFLNRNIEDYVATAKKAGF